MKKALLCGSIQFALVASALAQGTVVFENSINPGQPPVGLGLAGSYGVASTITVALLWAPGTSVVPQSALTQIGTLTFVNNGGYFFDGTVLLTGPATAGGTPAIFEVQAWIGTYPDLNSALASGALAAESFEFVNNTGNPTPPATVPISTTGWDGNLHIVPEPSTLALGACGGALLWAKLRRKKLA